MVEVGSAAWKLKKAAKRILLQTCGSFSRGEQQNRILDTNTIANSNTTHTVTTDSDNNKPKKNICRNSEMETVGQAESSRKTTSNKNLCTICLDPLNYGSKGSPGQAIFTAQCCHSFHFSCISSNIRHGSVTCPICRAHWTQLPHNQIARRAIRRVCNGSDPVLQILDDSITAFRVHRRSFLRSARYDDDDPIEPNHSTDCPGLCFDLLPIPRAHASLHQCPYATPMPDLHHTSGTSLGSPFSGSSQSVESPAQHIATTADRAYLNIALAYPPATDLVLVASPNGPHLRLLKQSMALVVSSLRPIDRLAIVTYSSSAARIFPLRCMTSYEKRTALQVIDRLFYIGQANPVQGLKKGVKILRDRIHKNPRACILHLSDSPTTSYHHSDIKVPITIHHIHVGFGFGTSNGFALSELEELLTRIVGGAIKDVKLRVDEDTRIISLGELRGREERRIPITLNESRRVFVDYSYIDTGFDECRRGRIELGITDKRERNYDERSSNVENWEYHDPFMARRWAKHLHGYRT